MSEPEWVKFNDEVPPFGVAVVMRRTGNSGWPGWEWQRPAKDLSDVMRDVLNCERSPKELEEWLRTTAAFSAQEIADLKHLVSIAVWIRSEQLVQRNVQRHIRSADSMDAAAKIEMPPTFIDTRTLHLDACVADMEHAQKMWEKLCTILTHMEKEDLQASWR